MVLKIGERQRKDLIQACSTAIREEESFIDAYVDVHDGSEKEPIETAEKFIRKWKKLIVFLDKAKEQ